MSRANFIRPTTNFTKIPNSILDDNTISLKAKGIYAFMLSKLSKYEEWNFTIRSMAKQLKEGITSIRTGLQELKEKGYIEYKKNRNGIGEYILKIKTENRIEIKNIDDENKPENKPKLENPNQGFSKVRKSDRINKKDYTNKKDNYKEEKKKKIKKKKKNQLLSFTEFKKRALERLKKENLEEFQNKIIKGIGEKRKAFNQLLSSEKFKGLIESEKFEEIEKKFNLIISKLIEEIKINEKFAPTLETILISYRENRLEKLGKSKQERAEKEATETWSRIVEYLKNYQSEPDHYSNKIIQATIQNLGNWEIFLDNYMNNFQMTRVNFLKTYKFYYLQGKNYENE